MAEPVRLKYRAFISYSHSDTSWAKWLHAKLEGFPIDKDLVGRETTTGAIPKTLRPIFRDRDDFTAGHTLSEQTQAALDASHSLIVICSPASAKSHYVNEEVRLFKSRHPERPLVPLIVGGKPGDAELECFPPALKFKLDAGGQVTHEPVDMLAADAREEGDGKNLALAKVVASLLGLSSDDIFRRAERERRRQGRVRNGVITVLAILAVAATGSAIYAWQQLKTNEAFLNETLQVATEIVNTAVAQAETYGIPRTATLAMLTKAEGLFDVMARRGRATPMLRYRKALMLIEFARNYEIVGDTRKWKERADEARGLLTELVSEYPDDLTYQQGLSAAQVELGQVLMAQGDLAAGLKSYRDSLAITDRLAKIDPRNASWQSALAASYIRIGEVLQLQGDLSGALKAYQDSLSIRDRLVKAEPNNADWQREFSTTYSRVGEVLEKQGNLVAALNAYQESLSIRDRLAKANRSNAGWQRDLSISYIELSGVLQAQGDLMGALKASQNALSIRDRLVKDDPSNADWQVQLFIAYHSVGDVLRAQNSLDDALNNFRKALAISEHVAAADPTNAFRQRGLYFSIIRVADTLIAQGKPAEALQLYQDGLAIAELRAKADPTDADWQRELAFSSARIGSVLEAQSDLVEALKAFRVSLAITERLAKADPSNVGWQRDLAAAHDRIGNVLMSQGKLAEAQKFFQDTLIILERLDTDSSDPNRQRILASRHAKIGWVLAQQNEAAQALGEYRRARDLIAQLKEQSAEDASLTDGLALIDAEITKLQQESGAASITAKPEQAGQ